MPGVTLHLCPPPGYTYKTLRTLGFDSLEDARALEGEERSSLLDQLGRLYREEKGRDKDLSDGALYLAALLLEKQLAALVARAADLGAILERLETGARKGWHLETGARQGASDVWRSDRRFLALLKKVAQEAKESEEGYEPETRETAFLERHLPAALASLSPSDQRIARLLLEDKDPKDIAEEIECSHGSAKVRCLKVWRKLTAFLREKLEAR